MTYISRFVHTTMAVGLLIGFTAQAQTETTTTTTQTTQIKTPVVYPAKGQSQTQKNKDMSACKTWAQQQTGFDPETALAQAEAAENAPVATQPPRGGAGRGAATGAAIGAVAGDAGKGAAAGAAAGAIRRRSDIRQDEAAQAQQEQQQTAALNQKIAGYNRALTACMEGRGYTVVQ